jgi:hypothetical protein
MYNQYLVTPIEVRSYCPEVNGDISDLLINRATLATEDTILRDTLGQQWSDEIISQKSGGTYTVANAYIVNNFLKLLVSLSVWQYLVMTLSLQLNSSGLRIKSSEHSIAAESKDLAFFRDFIENYMDRVRKTMKRYIDDHKTDYPLYYNNEYHDKPSENIWNFRIGKI